MHSFARQTFLENMAQTSPNPLALHVVRAEGNYLFDVDGNKYLDLIAGISVCNIGHQHPAVVQAVQAQAAEFMHVMVYGETVQTPQSNYAKQLVYCLPENLNCCYFVNSGAEAIDGAMKLAKRVTGKTQFVALTDAYHGSTQGPLSLMSNEYYSQSYRPLLPSVHFVNQNDLSAIDHIPWSDIAGVVVEIVQAERGDQLSSSEFLQALRRKCDQHCCLLIFDEIQTGFGRTGTLFAFEQVGIVPDVLVLGKALGGGMPMGAFIADRALMSTLSNQPILGHITTFGGHPVVAAAGAAALNVLQSEDLISAVFDKEKLFRQCLKHPRILAIHGRGLMLAVELADFDSVQLCIQKMLDKGLFSDWFLFAPNCLRISPPLTISHEEIESACQRILAALEEN
ncbi:MAG: aspartate aminotransferase family protein [Bacteroidota bacterium]